MLHILMEISQQRKKFRHQRGYLRTVANGLLATFNFLLVQMVGANLLWISRMTGNTWGSSLEGIAVDNRHSVHVGVVDIGDK